MLIWQNRQIFTKLTTYFIYGYAIEKLMAFMQSLHYIHLHE